MVIIDTPAILSFYDQWKLNRIRNTRHATSEERGVPVPRTGNYGMRKSRNGHGVSAGSHVLSHWYRDETWEGKNHTRRTVRRIETRMWRAEWSEELTSDTDGYDVGEWFGTSYGDTDWGYYENYDPTVDAPYYGVPYGDWDDYGYMPGEGYGDEWEYQRCGDPYCPTCDEMEGFRIG